MDSSVAIRREAEGILELSTGPWSEGQGLPPSLREAMIVRFEHLATHARAITDHFRASQLGLVP